MSFDRVAWINQNESVVHRSIIEISLTSRGNERACSLATDFWEEERDAAETWPFGRPFGRPIGRPLKRDSLAAKAGMWKCNFSDRFRAGEADWCTNRKLPLVLKRFCRRIFSTALLAIARRNIDGSSLNSERRVKYGEKEGYPKTGKKKKRWKKQPG